MSKVREHWGTRVGLILAMAGNAVGLGNFLRFPKEAVENGGGAFLIPYFVSFLLMGLPLLWVEWSMGRYGGNRGNHSTPFILDSLGKGRHWKYLGVFGIFTNLGIIAYYTYIESWTLSYMIHSLIGTFNDLGDRDQISVFFDHYVDIGEGQMINLPWLAIGVFIITLSINVFILSRGLERGIELAAKIGVPTLLVFGIILAIRGVTLEQGEQGASYDAAIALDFLWNPQFDSLANPKVWLAAAGQVFFTLSVGMGPTIVYASYVANKDDIALNATSAGWMNEFVEVVLGASVVIPIATAYMGIDWVQENAGFMMAFKTMPYLFHQWGPVLSVVAGVLWFGLLFLAGITSSLAMGTPWMSFMEDEFDWSRNKAALVLGGIVLLLAIPTILFLQAGVFDEFDYWTGTVSLVVFALSEIILFSWVFGIDKGWQEINRGADIKIPRIYYPIIKYVTPVFIILIFIGSLIQPADADWVSAFNMLFSEGSWPFHDRSIIAQLFHLNIAEHNWFIDGKATRLFILDMSRFLLLAVFMSISALVFIAAKKREKYKVN